MTTDNIPTLEESCGFIAKSMKERLGPAYDAEILTAIGRIMALVYSHKPPTEISVRSAAFDLYSDSCGNAGLSHGTIFLAALYELGAAE